MAKMQVNTSLAKRAKNQQAKIELVNCSLKTEFWKIRGNLQPRGEKLECK